MRSCKRPYLKREWCIRVIEHPMKIEIQEEDERVRFWGRVDELEGRVLRVVTLADRLTYITPFQIEGLSHEDQLLS